ncbi:MAG: hypothetical protein AAFQ81_09295 [Pseudomonadota bacterium]
MTLKWNGDAALRQLRARVARNMAPASLYVAGQVQRKLNRGNASGADPSVPGEPPKKVTGRLQQSITSTVRSDASSIRGVIGTNVVYARRLELGFFGTDSRGRNISQEPRPFLLNTLRESASVVNRIIGRR